VTVPELGLSHHHINRNRVLVTPPSLPHHGGWERADGMVVNFGFSPRFFEVLAEQVGLSQLVSKRPWHHFFAIDQRTEALCRLLMEETEDQCTHRPLYFEPLACALALRVLDTVGDQHGRKLCAAAVPPGVRRAVKCLEADFADDLSLNQLAAKAQMSRSHFALPFGKSPVTRRTNTCCWCARTTRANSSRKVVQRRRWPEIAAASGFVIKRTSARHFRRFFGTTPAAFRSQQERF
jgi:AraC family transcriptional regulator